MAVLSIIVTAYNIEHYIEQCLRQRCRPVASRHRGAGGG